MELLLMPETFLLFRFFFEDLGYTQQWKDAMAAKEGPFPKINVIHNKNF